MNSGDIYNYDTHYHKKTANKVFIFYNYIEITDICINIQPSVKLVNI